MKVYEVSIGGIPHTLQLSDEEAKARGLKPADVKQAAEPANKARSSQSSK